MKIKISLLILVTVVIATLFFKQCQIIRENAKNNELLCPNYRDTIIYQRREYKSKIGDTIKYLRQQLVDKKLALQLGLIREKDLRDKYLQSIQIITKLKEEMSVKWDTGKYVNSDTIKEFSCEGLRLDFDEGWYNLKVKMSKDNPIIEDMTIYSEPILTYAKKKEGFLKKSELVVTYENRNPYMNVLGGNSITITEQKRFYETTFFKIGVGFVGGIIAGGMMR